MALRAASAAAAAVVKVADTVRPEGENGRQIKHRCGVAREINPR